MYTFFNDNDLSEHTSRMQITPESMSPISNCYLQCFFFALNFLLSIISLFVLFRMVEQQIFLLVF